MKRQLSPLLLTAIAFLTFGCPGSEYFEDRKEFRISDCLAYGGIWNTDRCTPEFEEHLVGEWSGTCAKEVAEGSVFYVRNDLTVTETELQLTKKIFADELCSQLIEAKAPESSEVYSLYITAEEGSGKRSLSFDTVNSVNPQSRFSRWKEFTLKELKLLSVAPANESFSRP